MAIGAEDGCSIVPMFDSLSGTEILTIAVIALVVFGPGRLPDIARTIGRYLRELKTAVTDLRQGIEQEIGPISEPLKEIKRDLEKPVSDVRRTLTETAEAAKAAERDIKRTAKGPATGTVGAAGSVAAASAGKADTGKADTITPQARWVAPEPPTGVSPSDVWKGMDDPMPESVHPPPAADPPPDGAEAAGGADTDEDRPDGENTQAADGAETDEDRPDE